MTQTACGDISSRGATLLFATAIDGTYNEVGPITAMPNVKRTAETDVCSNPYGDDNDGYEKQFKTGKFTAADQTFTVKIREGDATHAQLKSYFDGADKDLEGYLRVQLASTNATKFTMPVIVKDLDNAFPPDGGICTLAVTVGVNGKPDESTT